MTQEQIDQIRSDFEQEYMRTRKDFPGAREEYLRKDEDGQYADDNAYVAFHYWQAAHARYAGGGEAVPFGYVITDHHYDTVSFTKHKPDIRTLIGSQIVDPIYTHPAPAVPDAETLRPMLEKIQDALQEAYQGAGAVCCGNGRQECCGSPEPEWSETDQKIMNLLGPVQTAVSAMLTASKEGKQTAI